jgi:hypothetical protein
LPSSALAPAADCAALPSFEEDALSGPRSQAASNPESASTNIQNFMARGLQQFRDHAAIFHSCSSCILPPNTRIQGGADVRGSGANAGAGAQTDNRIETDKSAVGEPSEARGEPSGRVRADERGNVAGPDKSGPEKEKPISERKPQERELEDAAKGGTAKPQQ